MQRWLCGLLAGAFLLTGAMVQAEEFKTLEERVSYSIGYSLGKDFLSRQMPVQPEILQQGVADAMADRKSKMTAEEHQQTLKQFQQQMQQRQQVAATDNEKQGQAFLKEQANKPGMKKLAGGVLYEVLTAGSGPKPKASDKVKVHYRGTLVDGTEFDSSYSRGKPASFALNRVIKGWTTALQEMPVGSKWRLVIPPDQAYGSQGAGEKIGPNAVLVFEVELLEIL